MLKTTLYDAYLSTCFSSYRTMAFSSLLLLITTIRDTVYDNSKVQKTEKKKREKRSKKYDLKLTVGFLCNIICFHKKCRNSFILSFMYQIPRCLLQGLFFFFKYRFIIHLLDVHTLRWKKIPNSKTNTDSCK